MSLARFAGVVPLQLFVAVVSLQGTVLRGCVWNWEEGLSVLSWSRPSLCSAWWHARIHTRTQAEAPVVAATKRRSWSTATTVVPWLPQRHTLKVWYRYTILAADAIAKMKTREEAELRHSSWDGVPGSYCCRILYWSTHIRARHGHTHRTWLPQRENLEARLLYRGCLIFGSCCGLSERAAVNFKVKNEKTAIFGFHGSGWLELGGKRSRNYLQDRTPLNALSAGHGARLGPTLAPWCTRGPPVCPAAKRARNDRRPVEQGMQMCKTNAFHTYTYFEVSAYPYIRWVMDVDLEPSRKLGRGGPY